MKSGLGVALFAAFAFVQGSVADDDLFGMSEQAALVKIDRQKGTETQVGSPLPFEGQAQSLGTIDDKNGIYYLLGFNVSSKESNLVGLDVTTGEIVSNVKAPFVSGPFIGLGQQVDFDQQTGHVIAGGRLTQDGPHVVGRLDPKTGAFVKVAELDSRLLPVLPGPSVFDTISRQEIVMFGNKTESTISLYAINVDTGDVSTIAEDPEKGRELSTLAYDDKTQLVYGLGMKRVSPTKFERTLVELDPRQQIWRTVGVIEGYEVASGGETTIDEAARALLWIGQKSGANQTDPFHLISVDLHSAKVTAAPILCNKDAECPWSIDSWHRPSYLH